MIIEQHKPFATPIFTVQYGNLKTHEELTNQALSLESKADGNQISNVGGFQSLSVDQKDSLAFRFWSEILNPVQQFISLHTPVFNYDTNLHSLWYNVNRKNHFNFLHNHPDRCFVSGIYYLKVPKDIHNAGDISFEGPDELQKWIPFYQGPFAQHNEFNSNSYYIKPNEGLLILFPSHLRHRVYPNLTDEPRISIAFNVEVKYMPND